MRTIFVFIALSVVVVVVTACDLIANTAACDRPSQCPSDFNACVDHQCAHSCTRDADCDAGDTCNVTSGACTPNPNGEGEGEGAPGEGEGEGAGEGEGEGAGEGEGEGAPVVRGLLADEIEIDDTIQPNSHTGDQNQMRVACNDDGSQCVVVWRDDRSEGFAVGDIFGAVVNVHASTVPVVFPITLVDGEQSEPDVAFTGGVFVVAWDDQRDPQHNAIFGTTVTLAANGDVVVAPEVLLANDARTPSLAAAVDDTTGFDARLVFQQTVNGNLRVARLTSLAQPTGADLADIGVSSSLRASVAANVDVTAVLWVDPTSTVKVSRVFTQQAAADLTVETGVADVERLSAAAGAGDAFALAVSHSVTNVVETFNEIGGAVTATTGGSVAGIEGALANTTTMALTSGGAVELDPDLGNAPLSTNATATGSLGVSCLVDACVIAADNDSDGFVVGATVGTTGGIQQNVGRGADRQENVSAVQVSDGHVVVAWSERTDATAATLKARVFSSDFATSTAVSDLGAIDIDVPTALGTDGTRVIAAAKLNGGLHVVEINVVDGVAVGTKDVGAGPPATVAPVVVPVGADGVVVAFTDGAHVHALPATQIAFLGNVEPAINNGDATSETPALLSSSDHADLAWSHADGTVVAATIPLSGGTGASALSVDATCAGSTPIAAGFAPVDSGVLAVRAKNDASGQTVFVCPFGDGGVLAPLVSNATNVGARYTMARINAGNIVIAATSVGDARTLAFTTIDTTGDSVTSTTPAALPTPLRSLAIVSGFVVYHRFDDDPAVVANRALALPLP